MNENLPVVSKPSEAAVHTNPEEIMLNAATAAKFLKKMIADTHSSMKIGNSEHIKFEAWQTVGRFFNVSVNTDHVMACNVADVPGAQCIASLIDNNTGRIVGGGVAYCMRDERNWENKPWFQLASMAQTRAASKALANQFRWISVMAGYAPTPAEEMEDSQPVHYEKPKEPTVTFDMAAVISSIRDMLAKMNAGDEALMDSQLKEITKYTAKDQSEKWLKLSDLPSIANRKPDWLKVVQSKVAQEYKKALSAQG